MVSSCLSTVHTWAFVSCVLSLPRSILHALVKRGRKRETRNVGSCEGRKEWGAGHRNERRRIEVVAVGGGGNILAPGRRKRGRGKCGLGVTRLEERRRRRRRFVPRRKGFFSPPLWARRLSRLRKVRFLKALPFFSTYSVIRESSLLTYLDTCLLHPPFYAPRISAWLR